MPFDRNQIPDAEDHGVASLIVTGGQEDAGVDAVINHRHAGGVACSVQYLVAYMLAYADNTAR